MQSVVSWRVHSRSDLLDAADDEVALALADHRPHALITERIPGPAALSAWQAAMADEPMVMVHLDPAGPAAVPAPPSMFPEHPSRPRGGIAAYRVGRGQDSLIRALAVAERFVQERLLAAERKARPSQAGAVRSGRAGPGVRGSRDGLGESVLLVGAGIVNLVTAAALLRERYQVTIADARPDPRQPLPGQSCGRAGGGSAPGGALGSARMFSLTGAGDSPGHGGAASPGAGLRFDRPPSALGWDIRQEDSRTLADQEWVRSASRVPGWLARSYARDALGLSLRSGGLWEKWIGCSPELFDASFIRRDLLHLYEDPAMLATAWRRQDDAGAALECLSEPGVRDRFPGLADAVTGAFAGGVLIRGFTLDGHALTRLLLDRLEGGGALLRFCSPVRQLRRDDLGQVTGVATADGMLRYDHYVLSPGVDGGPLLHRSRAGGLIHGVLHCQTAVPNLAPRLENSLIVSQPGHPAAEASITVGQDEHGEPALVIGAGHGWTGSDPRNIDPAELEHLHQAAADTLRRLFPRACESIGGDAGLRKARAYGVRPWTASGLGVLDIEPAANGRLVITSGHGTGGFAQAPVFAEAVLDALRGRHHPMHVLCHPLRTQRALGPVRASAPLPQ